MRDRKRPTIALLLAAISVMVSLVAIGTQHSDEEIAQRHYCEMVDLHKQDPSLGWPDYEHSYADNCKGSNNAR